MTRLKLSPESRIIGIDPGANTGLVCIDGYGEFIERTTISPSSKEFDLNERLSLTHEEVESFLDRHRAAAIGFEGLRTYFADKGGVKTFGIQAQFVGAVRAAFARCAGDVVITEFAPPRVVGRGRNKRIVGLPTKGTARALLRNKWGKVADDLTEHEVDAAIIALEVLRQAGQL